jgi:DMSO/TMAO reductase YedYZ molybdopterin-dependent catalytic subunit
MRKILGAQLPQIQEISLIVVLLVFLITTGCVAAQPSVVPTLATHTPETTAEAVTETKLQADATPTRCVLPMVVAPTPPADIPGYAELDPTTGLHVTGKAQGINLETYHLEVTGRVEHPLTLSYDELRCMPKVEASPTLICPGVFTDIATWGGVPLKYLLDLAGLEEGASSIKLVSADGYSATVPMSIALSESSFLAYEWEGEPLPILHGFPLRAVFPPLPGNKWVKWLVRIEVY